MGPEENRARIHSIFTLPGVQHDVPKLAGRMDVTEKVVSKHMQQIGVPNRTAGVV
ncbi:MAG: hypothetical protein J6B10_07960 [Lachnospiraceae bacterium]|nr:hypothetical protein [Lachnospiraceae bacterium]